MDFGFPELPSTPVETLNRLVPHVRSMREQAGMSRRELAERTGISESTYRHFEETGQISLERFLRIAEVLGFLSRIDALFSPHAPESDESFKSLDEVERAYGRPTSPQPRRAR